MQNFSKNSIFADILSLNQSLASKYDTCFSWQYQPVKHTLHHPDGGIYDTYGLALYQCSRYTRLHLKTIADISLCQNFVENLALSFTLHQLSPVHFYDAVLDAVSCYSK